MRFITILVIAFILFSCEKDTFETTPHLKYKSANVTTVSRNQLLVMKLDLTDKEGDFSSFLVIKKTVKSCPASDFIDSALFVIPNEFISAKKTSGELIITLDSRLRKANGCFVPGGGIRPDTAIFSFCTRDKAGHVSDTAYSEQIILLP